MTPAPSGPGTTAVFVAHARAAESRRPDRLFTDPYAAALAAGDAPAAMGRESVDYVAVRTRFFDDGLQAAAAAGVRQIVLVAAGLDTRAWRLPWPPGVRLYEVDLAPVLDYKDAVLAGQDAVPGCDRRAVPADLRGDWTGALVASGLDPEAPVAWAAEGILYYLAEAESEAFLTAIGRLSPPGSALFAEHFLPYMLLSDRTRAVREAIAAHGAAWRSAVLDPRAWLAPHGWRAEAYRASDPAVACGRAVPDESDEAPRTWLIKGARRTD